MSDKANQPQFKDAQQEEAYIRSMKNDTAKMAEFANYANSDQGTAYLTKHANDRGGVFAPDLPALEIVGLDLKNGSKDRASLQSALDSKESDFATKFLAADVLKNTSDRNNDGKITANEVGDIASANYLNQNALWLRGLFKDSDPQKRDEIDMTKVDKQVTDLQKREKLGVLTKEQQEQLTALRALEAFRDGPPIKETVKWTQFMHASVAPGRSDEDWNHKTVKVALTPGKHLEDIAKNYLAEEKFFEQNGKWPGEADKDKVDSIAKNLPQPK